MQKYPKMRFEPRPFCCKVTVVPTVVPCSPTKEMGSQRKVIHVLPYFLDYVSLWSIRHLSVKKKSITNRKKKKKNIQVTLEYKLHLFRNCQLRGGPHINCLLWHGSYLTVSDAPNPALSQKWLHSASEVHSGTETHVV